jgi:hypothetical protein
MFTLLGYGTPRAGLRGRPGPGEPRAGCRTAGGPGLGLGQTHHPTMSMHIPEFFIEYMAWMFLQIFVQSENFLT